MYRIFDTRHNLQKCKTNKKILKKTQNLSKMQFFAEFSFEPRICIIFFAEYGNRFKNALPRCFHCVPIRLRLRLAIVCKISLSESIFEMHFPNRVKPYLGGIFPSGDSSHLIYCQGNRLSHFEVPQNFRLAPKLAKMKNQKF